MPLVSTPAIILSALRYGETSKIVRLATEDHGVQSAIAKGALRPKSRFGAALQVLSGGQAQFLLSERRELHILTAFDVTTIPVGLTSDVRRYATAAALAETMLRAAPADSHPEAYQSLADGLLALERAPCDEVPALALQRLWGLVGALGYSPGLTVCVRDGRPLEAGEVAFSVREGGALCRSCARGAEATVLPADARAVLVGFQRKGALPPLGPREAAAHRRLLSRYIQDHLVESTNLVALRFWQECEWGNGR